ncbi:metallophosphoesterase [Flavobacterium aquidurense]|uniref:metallophosphoesterase n=1 Tax=Flavobacterium aquidurense TaxID=362413 RepID=UPI0009241E09|nr:metallophosphoesterase [Flavobacterium aquidurense]OXA67360.1 metallophosphoesterase [Flavobacterium aquidurense]SHH65565.1 Predicted phosphohydrolase [Flavobacterium frigidimaris]
MKIQYCSDLHLEFPENKQYIIQNPIVPKADVLIMAGDIMPFAGIDRHKDFINYISDHFKLVFWLPGNHEYYYSDINDRTGVLDEKIRDNVFLVNNIVKEVSEVGLLFSTLWSRISPEKQSLIQQSMSDFKIIKNHQGLFTPDYYNVLHKESLQFLQDAIIRLNTTRNIVVTHHVPTFINYPEKYVKSKINEGFVTNLTDFIEQSNIDYWMFGHHHFNVDDFKIGNTKLITNQLGYVKYNENDKFSNKIINL